MDMTIEIRVPTLGESITEATIGKWFKKAGDSVGADEPLLELETDKVTLEVNAPSSGVLSEIVAKDGDTVETGALLGHLEASNGSSAAPAAKAEGQAVKAAPPAAQPAAPAPVAPSAPP